MSHFFVQETKYRNAVCTCHSMHVIITVLINFYSPENSFYYYRTKKFIYNFSF